MLACKLLLAGCGFKAGLINEPPAPRDTSIPSKITVHRGHNIVGFVIPMTFLINSVGSRQYNDRLGQRRADASKQYLVSYGGLNPARIRTSSAGADNPVATNDTEAGRARNRRIEIRADHYSRGPKGGDPAI